MQSHINYNKFRTDILADNFVAKCDITDDMRDNIKCADGKECTSADFAVYTEAYGFFPTS